MIYLMDEAGAGYRAGACNIGPAEIARRRRAAASALAAALVIAAALVAIGAPIALRTIVFLPLAGGLVSWLQVRRRFCVAFGLMGVLNFGGLGAVEQVADRAARAADRRAALGMIVEGSLAALVLTVLFVLLPL